MSRIGKQPISIPEKTTVTVEKGRVLVQGPLGELSRALRPEVEVVVKDGFVMLSPKADTPTVRALWGTYASLIKSMVQGVTTPFEKKLVIEGVGYKAGIEGGSLTMQLGFSHPTVMEIPEGLNVSVEKNTISVSGMNKEQVGQFAAEIRAKKKPEPYKGKGIRYEDEVIRRKQGKKAV